MVDDILVEASSFSEYYTKNPIIILDESFNKILDEVYTENIPKTIRYIFTITDIIKFKKEIVKLPLEIIENILEYSIISNEKNITTNKLQRDFVLDIYKNDYTNIKEDGKEIWISWFLYPRKNIIRCLDNINSEWKDCTDKYSERYKSIKMEKESKKRSDNPYGYFGLINEKINKLK